MRDASLDEFLAGTDDEPEEDVSAVEGEADDIESAQPESEPEPDPEVESESESEPERETDADTEAESAGQPPVAAVEPARSTFAWSPDGATCAACGESVAERWESEVGLVCVECKEW